MQATRESWKTCPLPHERRELAFSAYFSVDALAQLRAGVIPDSMDDKWFVFCEDDWVYFHRSWTGFCVFWLQLIPSADGASVGTSVVDCDATQYRAADVTEERRRLRELIYSVILER